MRRQFLAALLSMAALAQPDPLTLVRNRDYQRLGKLLTDPKFLAKENIAPIMSALTADARADTAAFCHALYANKEYMANPDRLDYLLEILAVVKPMTEQTLGIFRTASQQGYFAFNAIRLAANGSPLAMKEFESMMLDNDAPIATRTTALRYAIIPRRTAPSILTSAGNILARATDEKLANAVIESVFDYRREWFRPDNAATPAPWETASQEGVAAAIRLSESIQRRRNLPTPLRAAVERETAALRKLQRR